MLLLEEMPLNDFNIMLVVLFGKKREKRKPNRPSFLWLRVGSEGIISVKKPRER